MREIKFRYIFRNLKTNDIIVKFFTLNNIESGHHLKYDIDRFELISTSQYTRLKDKNDVEIYDGDIVYHNGFIGYVKYINRGNCNVLGYALVSLINGKTFYMFCDETDNYEVIGNIYENQDLIKG